MKRILFLPALMLMLLVSFSLPARAEAPAAGKLVVAVLYFDNNTPDRQYDVLQKGLADMMVTDLSAIDGLQVVEREKLQKLVDELNLQKTSFFDPATAQKLGRGIGASYAVTGAIAAIEPQIRLDVRLIEIATGKVVLADKIVGARDRFFELQEQLTAKFAAGLKLHRTTGAAPVNRVADVKTLLDYSKGVDSADRGDLQSAAAQLSQVVQQDPEFRLARIRRDQIEQQLAASGRKREAIMASLSDELVQHADEFLKGKDVGKLSQEEAGRYFGYRAMRGDYIWWELQKQLSPKAVMRAYYSQSTVLPANRDAAVALMKTYDANASSLLAELQTFQAAKDEKAVLRLSYRMEKEDETRATQLGIRWRFSPRTLIDARLGLARLLLLGQVQRPQTAVRPSLAQLDPAFATKGLALIEAVIADLPQREPRDQERDFVEAQKLAGEGLIALGRESEGIARWQAILDRYPTSPDYTSIESQIREQLEAEKQDVEDTATVNGASCDLSLVSLLAQAMPRIMKRHGFAAAKDAVARVEARCGTASEPNLLLSLDMALATSALIIGECDTLAALKDKAVKAGSSYAATYDGLLRQCH